MEEIPAWELISYIIQVVSNWNGICPPIDPIKKLVIIDNTSTKLDQHEETCMDFRCSYEHLIMTRDRKKCSKN